LLTREHMSAPIASGENTKRKRRDKPDREVILDMLVSSR
jgi:hypothetical protein